MNDKTVELQLTEAAEDMYVALVMALPRLEYLHALAICSYGKNFTSRSEDDIRNYKVAKAAIDKARGK